MKKMMRGTVVCLLGFTMVSGMAQEVEKKKKNSTQTSTAKPGPGKLPKQGVGKWSGLNNGNWYGHQGNGEWNSYNNKPWHGNDYDYSDTEMQETWISCAPDLVESNVSKTDRLLQEVLKDKRFTSSDQFKSIASEILMIKDEKSRLAAYFSLVGVESTQEIFYFVGAREEDYDRYESHLVSVTSLDSKLAELLVSKLIKTLKAN